MRKKGVVAVFFEVTVYSPAKARIVVLPDNVVFPGDLAKEFDGAEVRVRKCLKVLWRCS